MVFAALVLLSQTLYQKTGPTKIKKGNRMKNKQQKRQERSQQNSQFPKPPRSSASAETSSSQEPDEAQQNSNLQDVDSQYQSENPYRNFSEPQRSSPANYSQGNSQSNFQENGFNRNVGQSYFGGDYGRMDQTFQRPYAQQTPGSSRGTHYNGSSSSANQSGMGQTYGDYNRSNSGGPGSSYTTSDYYGRPGQNSTNENQNSGRFNQGLSPNRYAESQNHAYRPWEDSGSGAEQGQYYTKHGAGSPYQQSQESWSSPSKNSTWSNSSQYSPLESGNRQQMGMHSGKAPKGYRRSDDRIKEEVCEALTHHSEIDPSEVEVDVKDGVVQLTGTAESRQVKSMVEDLAERINGVIDVRNDIRIMAKESYSKNRISESAMPDAAAEQSRTSTAMNTKNQQSQKPGSPTKSMQ